MLTRYNYPLFTACLLCALMSCTALAAKSTKSSVGSKTNNPLEYVDPYIGTLGHGHTFLGVSAPFGAVQLGPSNFNKGWDWCSAYHYSDSVVIGFSHLHLNGTGCSDTGDLLFMPYTGDNCTVPGTQENPDLGYASRYSHDRETARPNYYSLILDDYDVKVELTASPRVGFHRYTYPDGEQQRLMINLKDANGDDRAVETFMEQVDKYTIQGYRYSAGWSKQQRIYFTAQFSEPVALTLYDDSTPHNGTSLKGLAVKGNVSPIGRSKQLMVKVGISPVSMANALANIESEVPHWNFEKVAEQTADQWNKELAKIKVETDDVHAKRIFYTGMYHAFIQPNLFNDCNRDYRGTDKKVYPAASFTNYTVFSLWDTYRAAHPLYTIVQPERVPDFINSFLAINREQGMLPVWHLYGSETKEMIGIQSIPVIADAIMKGIEGFDYNEAFEAMKSSMLSEYKGLKFLHDGQYIPSDLERESVAKGLEYAIADWSIAQVAKKMGKDDDYKLFSQRALNYKEYWDSELHFFRGKNRDGRWSEPFNPLHSSHRNDDYCEGTGWQYTWLVPHDVKGLISLFGSESAFSQKLDSLFTITGDMGENASGDISGLIGQYAHGNEPGHHTTYLYAYVGEQWKTAQRVRYILDNMYSDNPDGYQGNEDCGQMSSWYILSSIGFYPVNPSNGVYVFGTPLFDRVGIDLPDGRKFTVRSKNAGKENAYIQSATLNSKPYTKSYITHADIMNGGELVFTMGNTPNKQFGKAPKDRP